MGFIPVTSDPQSSALSFTTWLPSYQVWVLFTELLLCWAPGWGFSLARLALRCCIDFLSLLRVGATVQLQYMASHSFPYPGAWALGYTGFRSCDIPAQLLHGMWDPPRPGAKPLSPALASGFFTTGSPGRSKGKPFKSSFSIRSWVWPPRVPSCAGFSSWMFWGLMSWVSQWVPNPLSKFGYPLGD